MHPSSAPRPQSAAEERANSLSHGLGFVLAALALPVLGQLSAQRDVATLQRVGLVVFVATMMLMYLSSALFHGLPAGRGKRFFEQLDHAAIYLFIAGSYTAFAAAQLQGTRAWAMFVLVWVAAGAGVLLTLCRWVGNPLWSTGLYVAMGWLVLLAALPWIAQVSPTSVRLLVAGGAVYTLGALLFLLSARLPYAHLAWHLCVMVGSGLHGAAVVATWPLQPFGPSVGHDGEAQDHVAGRLAWDAEGLGTQVQWPRRTCRRASSASVSSISRITACRSTAPQRCS